MKSARMLLGSVIVYLSVASINACSATAPNLVTSAGSVGGSSSPMGHGGATAISSAGIGGTGGSGSGLGGALDSGIFDALTDPVPNASADPVSGSRLKAHYQTSDDGGKAYIAGAWYDSQRQEDCGFVMATDGILRCLPISLGQYPSYFSDSSCQQPLAIETSPGCAPTYVLLYAANAQACQSKPTYEIRQTLAKVSLPLVYIGGGGSCNSYAPDPSTALHLTGPAIPPSSFVGGSYQHD